MFALGLKADYLASIISIPLFIEGVNVSILSPNCSRQMQNWFDRHSPMIYLGVSSGFGVTQVLMNASASTGNEAFQWWALCGVAVLMAPPILHGTCKNKQGAPVLFVLSYSINFMNLWQSQPWMLGSDDTVWVTMGIAVLTAVISIGCDDDMRTMVASVSALKQRVADDPTCLLRLWKLIISTVKTGLFTQVGRLQGAGTGVLAITIGDSLFFSMGYYRANHVSPSIDIRLPRQRSEWVDKIVPLLVLLAAILAYEIYTMKTTLEWGEDETLLSVAFLALLAETTSMALYHKVRPVDEAQGLGGASTLTAGLTFKHTVSPVGEARELGGTSTSADLESPLLNSGNLSFGTV